MPALKWTPSLHLLVSRLQHFLQLQVRAQHGTDPTDMDVVVVFPHQPEATHLRYGAEPMAALWLPHGPTHNGGVAIMGQSHAHVGSSAVLCGSAQCCSPGQLHPTPCSHSPHNSTSVGSLLSTSQPYNRSTSGAPTTMLGEHTHVGLIHSPRDSGSQMGQEIRTVPPAVPAPMPKAVGPTELQDMTWG